MVQDHDESTRHLVLVLGDQLDRESAAFDGFDRQADLVWMVEVRAEAEHVWASKPHIAILLRCMRHFCDALRTDGVRVDYRTLDDPENLGSLDAELLRAVEVWRPKRVIVVKPGEWRAQQLLCDAGQQAGAPLEIRQDRHFLCPPDVFEEHAEGRRQLVMEHFYREMRRRTGVLMDGDTLVGGQWNYDPQNRRSLGREGPIVPAAATSSA